MENDRARTYRARIERVVDYIHAHYDEPLDVDRLSAIAHFSRFHFHRQFTACIGIPAYRLVQVLRLNHACRQLAFSPERRVLDIALDAGFDSPEAFSRAFHKLYGQSPAAFRRAPRWQHWRELVARIPQPQETGDMQVDIIDFPRTKVALLEHRGPEALVYQTTQRFIEWRRAAGVGPDKGRTYGLHYCDARTTLPEDYRFDICVSYEGEVAPNPQGVVSAVIPAGRCARVRYHGSRDYIPAAEALYREWLPASGEELRDYPFFFHYVNVGPDVREKDMITDLYLPLKG